MDNVIFSQKLKAGDEQAFATFYKEYYSLFLAFTLKFIHDPEGGRDVVQDVFISYLKCRSSFDDLIQIKVFFYRSIRNKCLNLINRQKTHDKFLKLSGNDDFESTEYFLHSIIREETAFAIHQEIAKLSPTGQQVLKLALDGKSNEEIAVQLDISVNTVKTHKARSYASLRKQLFQLRLILLLTLKK